MEPQNVTPPALVVQRTSFNSETAVEIEKTQRENGSATVLVRQGQSLGF